MADVFSEIPFTLEVESLIRLTTKCRITSKGSGYNREQKVDLFEFDLFYKVIKFDYSADKKDSSRFLSLATFAKAWSDFALKDALCELLSVDVEILNLRITPLSSLSGKSNQVQYRYPLSMFGKAVGAVSKMPKVWYFELLYKDSSVPRAILIKGVPENISLRDPKDVEVITKVERLFITSFLSDSNKLELKPVRVARTGKRSIKIDFWLLAFKYEKVNNLAFRANHCFTNCLAKQ